METLRQLPLFSAIDTDDLAQWLHAVPHRREVFRKGALIVRQDEPCRSVYCLTRGSTRMEMGEEGRGLTIDRLDAPDILASAFIFASENRFPVSVFAETECTLWIIGREAFFDFMLTHPAVMRHFVRDISDRSQFLSRKLRSFALKSLRDRFLEILRRCGRIDSVSRTARLLGVQRPSLSRLLADLLAEGIIDRTAEGGFVMNDK